MTLNGVMAVTLCYLTEFGKPALQKTICGGIYSRVYCILVRVHCRRKESSRSPSHLLMSFLYVLWNHRRTNVCIRAIQRHRAEKFGEYHLTDAGKMALTHRKKNWQTTPRAVATHAAKERSGSHKTVALGGRRWWQRHAAARRSHTQSPSGTRADAVQRYWRRPTGRVDVASRGPGLRLQFSENMSFAFMRCATDAVARL